VTLAFNQAPINQETDDCRRKKQKATRAVPIKITGAGSAVTMVMSLAAIVPGSENHVGPPGAHSGKLIGPPSTGIPAKVRSAAATIA